MKVKLSSYKYRLVETKYWLLHLCKVCGLALLPYLFKYGVYLGEEHKYGIVAFKDTSVLNDLCAYWKVQGDEEVIVRKETLTATAVASLFSWLNGQAHSLGSSYSGYFCFVADDE